MSKEDLCPSTTPHLPCREVLEGCTAVDGHNHRTWQCNPAIHHIWRNDVFWLVVWTPLKNISQLGWLFPIYGKIKNVPNHQPVINRLIILVCLLIAWLPSIHRICDIWQSHLNPEHRVWHRRKLATRKFQPLDHQQIVFEQTPARNQMKRDETRQICIYIYIHTCIYVYIYI